MKLPPTDTGACGTSKGYHRHVKRGEDGCGPCKKARADYQFNRKRGIYPEKAPDIHEVAAEIEHFTYMRQGTHTILKSLNRRGNAASLARQLERIGRRDLARIFEQDAA